MSEGGLTSQLSYSTFSPLLLTRTEPRGEEPIQIGEIKRSLFAEERERHCFVVVVCFFVSFTVEILGI